MENKKAIGFLLLLICVLSGFLAIGWLNPDLFKWNSKITNTDEDLITIYTNITLIVDFGNSSTMIQSDLSVNDNSSTVFSILSSLYDVEYDSYTNGKLVTSINGIRNNVHENTFWFYWVNDQYPNIASSSYLLQSNMTILWNYTARTF